MPALQQSYRGLSLLFELNWDRFLFLGALGAGLAMGAYLNSF
ncbi:hypothetical protein Q5Y75_03895 [Ruegeria sp. 2205SS24-7]|nr:hypothetical protein [Ruegeria sp. 2205SS24-7]MDP5216351.1 hypothetical protein [Ruegeria sp. 2205SS24-7]